MLLTELDRERNLLLAGIMRQGGPTLPAYWLAGRGLLFLCIFGFFGFLLLRRRAEDPRNRAAAMLGLISAAMGFASFSGMKVDWPLLPTKAVLLLTPFNVSTAMDVGLIAIYLAYGIPALILVLYILKSGVKIAFSRRI